VILSQDYSHAHNLSPLPSYDRLSGAANVTRLPLPFQDLITIFPPMELNRSRILKNPNPLATTIGEPYSEGLNPTPLSSTTT
jgi:hypothetical protein